MRPSGTAALLNPRRIVTAHWESVPRRHRRSFRTGINLLAVAVGALFLTGKWTITSVTGFAAAVAVFAGLLFGLVVQLFGMATAVTRGRTHEERLDLIRRAGLIRGLLANVTYATLWALLGATTFGLHEALADSEWWSRITLAVGFGALVELIASFLLGLRRAFDMAVKSLDVVLETPRDG